MNLRKLDWADIIVYFIDLKSTKSNKPKDLIDYFHFKYLTEIQLDRWTVPSYKLDTRKAQKVLDLYGWDFSLLLVDILFKEYNSILRDGIKSLQYTRLGLLSSDNCGWISEALFKNLKNEQKVGLFKLLEKPRESWTTEEIEYFQRSING